MSPLLPITLDTWARVAEDELRERGVPSACCAGESGGGVRIVALELPPQQVPPIGWMINGVGAVLFAPRARGEVL